MQNQPLFEHQTQSLEVHRGQDRVFDASDPGTGKTRVAIESFSERRIRGGGKALILAPKSILRAAWSSDFRKFAPHISTSCAFATNRVAAFRAEADAYITNHAASVWLAKRDPSFFEGYDTLIIDESGAFKNPSSQRSKAVNKIKRYFKYRLAMNGTPSPNTITEIWNQMFILDDGQRLGHSFFSFRMATCNPVQQGPSASHIKWVDKDGSADAVSKLMEDMTIRNKMEDCIDIPANHEYSVPHHLSPTHLTSYEQMAKDNIMELLSGDEIQAVNAAVLSTKLLQISSGAVYDENSKAHVVDTSRYELVLDLAEQRPHSLIFFLWGHQKDALIAEAKKRKLTYCLIDGTTTNKQRNEAVDLYQKGFYRICFAHPASAAHGLTLTRGTATIWASPTFNLEHYHQGMKRIHRAGQTKKTENIVIVAPGTIEEHVWGALINKRVRMSELLEQLAGQYNMLRKPSGPNTNC
jgi:SNF2 family DNA or RNA helicase